MLRSLILHQHRLSSAADALLPERFTRDGNRHFGDDVVPAHIEEGMTVYDVGGGRTPVVPPALKSARRLRVVGIDIDERELAMAPSAAYDATVVADISTYRGCADGDVVVCRALLEHVPDTGRAFEALASIAKPGGRILVFVPSRRAVFARLNRVLPEAWKRHLLFAIWPQARSKQGFRAYYDRCTPAEFERVAGACGLTVERRLCFYTSAYFKFFLPLHLAWRLWALGCYGLRGSEAAETFVLVLRKPGGSR